ncbi:MAG TPA: hypothetical protein ENK11_10315, partial [Phycisphaerales bacterium]|nr:hypothetical protein [Phycisphaerales bacterium]
MISPQTVGSRTPGAVAVALGLKKPYLIGIGGCGMSALARLLAADGAGVSGSDSTRSPVTEMLEAEGVSLTFEQQAGVLPEDIDGVICSAAIPADHPQLLEAQRRGLPAFTYAEALGRCMAGRTGVSIAGTHGKSTTTAMLGCVLTDAGLDPGVIVGATCDQLHDGCLAEQSVRSPERERGAGAGRSQRSPERERGAGFRLGSPEIPAGPLAGRPGLLLAEACEYNRSFHHHRPVVASIANVEADHLDIYGSLDAVIEAFAGFAALLPDEADGGRLLIGHDGAHRREITAGLRCRVETIGFAPPADSVVSTDVASGRVSLAGPGGVSVSWTNAMPGEHNALNSAVAA